jgi:pyruvate kinase
VESFADILAVSDGIMVARGDLGVDMPLPRIPLVQKDIIRRANRAGKPVITATQMLESMLSAARPTRAEVTDVANAIFDGTDAVMLSAETASGKYPVESVAIMDRIIREAESSFTEQPRPRPMAGINVAETISEAICHAAEELRMKVIAVFTESGSTARLVSKYRPRSPIVAFSSNQEVRRRLSLLWGVVPRSIEQVRDIDTLSKIAERRLLEEKLVRPGDVVGIVAGVPLGVPGTTNFMKLHTIRK